MTELEFKLYLKPNNTSLCLHNELTPEHTNSTLSNNFGDL